MQTKFYVESLDQIVNIKDTTVINKTMTESVKNQPITITAPVRIYKPTGEIVDDDQLDSQSMQQLFDQYAKQNNLLTKQEIINIRHQLKLSQRGFANLLGLSKATIEHYELGSLPNASNSFLIELVSQLNPDQLRHRFNQTNQNLYSKNDKLNYQNQS